MSTRSVIGLQLDNNKYKTIYCHNDGYLNGVGKKLINNYKSKEDVEKLLELGDLSSLGNIPVSDPSQWDLDMWMGELSNKCVSYRDRGDKDIEPKTSTSLKDIIEKYDAEFIYIFKDGKWYYSTDGNKLFPLSKAISESLNKNKFSKDGNSVTTINGKVLKVGDRVKDGRYITGFNSDTNTVFLDADPDVDGGADYDVEDVEDELVESSTKNNALESATKKHKKSNKGWGWFINHDAGDVETNTNFFNHVVSGNSTKSDGSIGLTTSSEGVAESFKENEFINTETKISNNINEDINNKRINYCCNSKLNESKEDVQKFIDKFGQDTYDNFNKSSQRLKNKGLSTDILVYVRDDSMTKKKLDDILFNLETKRSTNSDDLSEIEGKYDFLGSSKDYDVYQPLDALASMNLGVGTGWCTTGRYGHYGDVSYKPSFPDARKHWEEYTSKGVKFYYFLKNGVGKYALALYPRTLKVDKYIDDNTYLIETNFELYDAKDSIDYSALNKLPLDLIPEKLKIKKWGDAVDELLIRDKKLIKANKNIKNCVIPADGSITSIFPRAFSDCSSLTSITIPSSVTSIGFCAFSGCTSLTSITIPDSVTSIGERAFFGCSSLTSVIVPKNVTSIGNHAFNECISLKSVTISGNTEFGDGVFEGCSTLSSAIFLNSVTRIGGYAFSGCTGLTSITIPDSVTSIFSYAFSGCTGLTSLIIPSSVTSISSHTFSGCSSLTSITIPDSVIYIGPYAFSGCSSLTIYRETTSQPSEEDLHWKLNNRPVMWVYKKGNKNESLNIKTDEIIEKQNKKWINKGENFNICGLKEMLDDCVEEQIVGESKEEKLASNESYKSYKTKEVNYKGYKIVYDGDFSDQLNGWIIYNNQNQDATAGHLFNSLTKAKQAIDEKDLQYPIENIDESLNETKTEELKSNIEDIANIKVTKGPFTLDEVKTYINELNNELEKEGRYYQIYYVEEDKIEAEVTGDWKHDLLYFKFFVVDFFRNKNININIESTDITSDDEQDSDWGTNIFVISKIGPFVEHSTNIDNLEENLVTNNFDNINKNLKDINMQFEYNNDGLYIFKNYNDSRIGEEIICQEVGYNYTRINDTSIQVFDEVEEKLLKENYNDTITPYSYSQMKEDLILDLKARKPFTFIVSFEVEAEFCEKILKRAGFDYEYSIWPNKQSPEGHYWKFECTPKNNNKYDKNISESNEEVKDNMEFNSESEEVEEINQAIAEGGGIKPKGTTLETIKNAPIGSTIYIELNNPFTSYFDIKYYKADALINAWDWYYGQFGEKMVLDKIAEDLWEYKTTAFKYEANSIAKALNIKITKANHRGRRKHDKNISESNVEVKTECSSDNDSALEEKVEKHETLNSALWTTEKELKPEVKKKLLKVVSKFKEDLEEDNINLDIKDIIIIGSNASYNYTEKSDIDLHIIVNIKDEKNTELMLKILDIYKILFNNKYDIFIKGYKVEIYIDTNITKTVSNGVYSLNSGWIKEPDIKLIPNDIDETHIKEPLQQYIDRYNEIKNNPTIDSIDKLIDDLYKLRKEGMEGNEGEYSKNNLIFKEMRNRGYLYDLKNIKISLENKDLSLEQLQESGFVKKSLSGGVIYLSLDVDNEKLQTKYNWTEKDMLGFTTDNKNFYANKIDSICKQNDIKGYTIIPKLEGYYEGKLQNTIGIEFIHITKDKLFNVSQDILEEFKQYSLLVKLNSPQFLTGRTVYEVINKNI